MATQLQNTKSPQQNNLLKRRRRRSKSSTSSQLLDRWIATSKQLEELWSLLMINALRQTHLIPSKFGLSTFSCTPRETTCRSKPNRALKSPTFWAWQSYLAINIWFLALKKASYSCISSTLTRLPNVFKLIKKRFGKLAITQTQILKLSEAVFLSLLPLLIEQSNSTHWTKVLKQEKLNCNSMKRLKLQMKLWESNSHQMANSLSSPSWIKLLKSVTLTRWSSCLICMVTNYLSSHLTYHLTEIY